MRWITNFANRASKRHIDTVKTEVRSTVIDRRDG
jgi:hypothetical protein